MAKEKQFSGAPTSKTTCAQCGTFAAVDYSTKPTERLHVIVSHKHELDFHLWNPLSCRSRYAVFKPTMTSAMAISAFGPALLCDTVTFLQT